MKHALKIALFALGAAACADPAADETASDPAAQELGANTPGANDASKSDPAPDDVAYFGGRVIQNAKVYAVWWGPADGVYTELSQADGGIADFFSGILNSRYIDSLSRFNTDIAVQAGSKKGAAGTHQHIGRGNYAGSYALTDIPSGDVTDEQISDAIESAITVGTLPTPDANTIFMLYFPRSVKIEMEKMQSCALFAGYHYVTPASKHHVTYAVIPDCGWDYSGAQSVSSHELVESITDPITVRGGAKADSQQAWATSKGVEISDLCTSPQGSVSTERGSFMVQRWWDLTARACKVTAGAADDFAISTSDQLTDLSGDASTVATFQTTTTAGAAQTLALSVTAPKGVTATLSAKSVAAGTSVDVTLTVATGISLKDAQVVVTAVGDGPSRQIHTASLLVAR
jgi:hypothetical protein